MKNPAVDITNCDKEPIHIPGRTQSHGFLIAVNKSNSIISYVSENVKEKTGLEPAHVLGKSFEWFLEKSHTILQSLSLTQLLRYNDHANFDSVNPVLVEVQHVPHYLIVHTNNNILLAEFEPSQPSIQTEMHRLIGLSVSRILEGRTVKSILQNAATQIKEIIQYDRVMIYQFWDDGHGEVIAEAKADSLVPFMGLHYPASDIPKQARDLYLLNLTRIIADVHAPTSQIVAYNEGEDIEPMPLDLTHSALRAVSPVHIQYLKNMGVTASFSVSLVSHNKLWGLVACHNSTPKFIDYKAREAAKLIGQILSSSLEYRSDEENKEAARIYRQSADELITQMQKDWNVTAAFREYKKHVLQVTRAHGAALVFEGSVYTVGITPKVDDIKGITDWLKQSVTTRIFHTDNLSSLYKPAIEFADVASGLLVCTLSKEMNEHIMWFKPDMVKTVNWAGNPDKPVEADVNGQIKLSPRSSFEVWSQQVECTSESWGKAEISVVMKLREDIIHVINQKANQIRQLNEKLKEAYEELDTFSFTISHDLKTPLTSIKSYTEIILEEYPQIDEIIIKMLNRILKSTDKMTVLIKEVLSYSRISREELKYEEIHISSLVQDAVSELLMAYKNSNTNVVIKDLPNLKADKTMMMQAFSNVIGNAIKYSQYAHNPKVTIESEIKGNEVIFKISDNGIGIDSTSGNQIFEIFKRLGNVQQYEGSGVGLSIVKKIMEKHKGKIWYESELNQGTTFYLSFLNNKV